MNENGKSDQDEGSTTNKQIDKELQWLLGVNTMQV